MEKKYAITINHVTKYFKVFYDKGNTLKEKLIFGRKSKYEQRLILDDVDFKIEKGETVALIGVNGSGKSTLLKLMTKIIYPNKGNVVTNGKLTSLLELGAGFHPDFTGRENIYFNAAIFGLSKKEIDDRVDDIIKFSELEEYIDNPVRTYSSGMYMRLAFSIAISVDAEILLIDEILAVGDQHFQQRCSEKIKELRDSDKTIVLVTHDMNAVRRLCTRVIWLRDGRIFRDSTDVEKTVKSYLGEA